MSNLKNTHLFEAFHQAAETFSQQPALSYKEGNAYQSISYSALNQRIIQFGNLLRALGVRPQDKVAIILNNGPEYTTAFFAIMYTGATAVPLDNQFSDVQIQNILKHCGAKVFITTESIHLKIKKNNLAIQPLLIDTPTFENQINSVNLNYNFTPSIAKDALAVIFYTSGTTDNPKGVMLTHANLLSNVSALQELNIAQTKDSVISILPLHHAYSFTVTLLTPLFSGAKIVYPPSLNSADLLSCLREEKINVFVGVPQVFSLIHRSIDTKVKQLAPVKKWIVQHLAKVLYAFRKMTGINASKKLFKNMHAVFGDQLRYLISGGAKLDPEIATDFLKWGFTILEGYGLTETSPVVSFNLPGKYKIGSVGVPLKNVEIKIADPDAKGEGEVAIKGPNVMLGYYASPEQTAAVIKDGWFYTGDVGVIDSEGFLKLVGRRKEIIVLSNGKNINPEEVEKYYAQNPYVKEIAVLPTQSETLKGVEQLGAVVVVNEDQMKANNEINVYERLKWQLENLSAKLKSYQRISGFVISKENLPRTRLGKIKRYQLSELYRNLSQSHSSTSITDQAVQEDPADMIQINETTRLALAQLEDVVGRKVNLKDHLELDLGLDSLTRIELLLNLQERLKFTLTDEQSMEFYLCQRVEELVNQLQKFVSDQWQASQTQNTLQWSTVLKEQPSAETLQKIKTTFTWWEMLINLLFISIFKILFKLFFFLKTEGRDNLPDKGPYLICPNHTNYLDGLIIFSALPYKVILNTYFVGYANFFENRIVGPFIKIGRLIPIEINHNLTEFFKACSYIFSRSMILCYFPEGQRSIDGQLNEFKKGVGILVKELNLPVVPVYIEGALEVWPRGQKWPKIFLPIKVKFGPILTPEKLGAQVTPIGKNIDCYKYVAKNLQQEILKLKK